ncbi:YcxB family protein [Clostridium algidicarnis]|uniref:YcxB family protein n=1 Tax=Clostridium algidicarnis TaxID=37659 RepID=UPI001C0D1125|nr:YcxB family protein [Clostridium algidicarnis]MBU3197555.1 YcxB family protein [Clostridium algidicarnis]MBU3207881.1 YcxB family protein [Clostridium algidicarnis]
MDIKYSLLREEYINSKLEYILKSKDLKKRILVERYTFPIVILVPLVFLILKEGIFTFLILYIVSTTSDMLFTKKAISNRLEYQLNNEVNEFLLSINEAGLSITSTNYDMILYWSLFDKVVESSKYIHLYNSKEIISIPKIAFENEDTKNAFINEFNKHLINI